jgi:hypothetical protein
MNQRWRRYCAATWIVKGTDASRLPMACQHDRFLNEVLIKPRYDRGVGTRIVAEAEVFMVTSTAPTPPRRIRARCPRDRGRLLLEQDLHGTYLTCITCGFVLEERSIDQGALWQSQSQ